MGAVAVGGATDGSFSPSLDKLEQLSERMLNQYQSETVIEYYRESVRVITEMRRWIEDHTNGTESRA